MILGLRFLDNIASNNVYVLTDILTFSENDSKVITFELLDMSSDTNNLPPGRLYIPASGATLALVIQNIDDAKVINATPTLVATTPFWQFALSSGNIVGGTYSITLSLTEGTNKTSGYLNARIRVIPADSFSKGGFWA